VLDVVLESVSDPLPLDDLLEPQLDVGKNPLRFVRRE